MTHTLELLGIIILSIWLLWMVVFGTFIVYKFFKEFN